MKEYGSEQGSSVQNRFTAYLVTAVKNKRISYMERKHQQTEFEAERPGVLERSYTDFEQEYRQYKLEHLPWKYNGDSIHRAADSRVGRRKADWRNKSN